MYKFVNNVDKSVETVYLLKKSLRIWSVLIQIAGGQYLDQKLIEIHRFKHLLIREGLEVIIYGLLLVEQYPTEVDIPMLIGIQFLQYSATLSMHAKPLLEYIYQLFHFEWFEVDFDWYIFLDEVVRQGLIGFAVDSEIMF